MSVVDPKPEGIRRVCPVCSGNDSTPFLMKEALTLVQCSRCSMVYANPVEPELASGRFYDRLGVPFYLSPDKLGGDYAPVRFQRELRLFRRHCTGGAVLDVGCSTGAFLFQLRDRFPEDYSVTGTDVAGAALDHAASRGIEVVRTPFLEGSFGGRQFDAITFWAVMEHLVEPARFLAHAVSLLKPGGFCFLLVPNLKSLAVRVLGGKYRYIMPDHVNYFTAATLQKFAGLEPALEMVQASSSHFNPLVILKDLRGGAGRVADKERSRLLRRTNALKRNPWLAPLRWGYSAIEGTLAPAGLADNLFIVLRKRSPVGPDAKRQLAID